MKHIRKFRMSVMPPRVDYHQQIPIFNQSRQQERNSVPMDLLGKTIIHNVYVLRDMDKEELIEYTEELSELLLSNNQEWKDEYEGLEDKFDEMEKEKDNEIAKLEEDAEEFQNKIEDKEHEIECLNDEVERLEGMVEDLEEENRQILSLENEITELQRDRESLEERVEELESGDFADKMEN